jgi:steroid delta-isomerase-like uncharacterized protein
MTSLLAHYYHAFNAGDVDGMLNLLSDDVVHEPCQGTPRHGKGLFREFLEHMNHCYKEEVIDPRFLYATDGSHASAEFTLNGIYMRTDEPLSPAHGQSYTLRVGTFFDIQHTKITRVSNHYNLQHWIDQISVPTP